MHSKPIILIFIDWFSPAYKAGGPIQSCVNLVNFLEDDYKIYVVTSDRDLGDRNPYNNITLNKWISINNNSTIKYLSRNRSTYQNIKKIVKNINPDFIYLNSMFSRIFTIYPLLLFKFNRLKCKLILVPRGMLKTSALQHKKVKKFIFIRGANLFGLFNNIFFQASNDDELLEIKKNIKNNTPIVLSNLPSTLKKISPITKLEKQLNLLFIGRIHTIKNLDFTLQILSKVDKKNLIQLQIIGPREDEDYWCKCVKVIKVLPVNIKVEYLGALPPSQVEQNIKANHFLILPTKGENFGHVIFESFAKGRPVIISNQTPWRNLKSIKVGWDIPLKEEYKFIEAINTATTMKQKEYDAWSKASHQFASNYLENSNLKERYLKLFS